MKRADNKLLQRVLPTKQKPGVCAPGCFTNLNAVERSTMLTAISTGVSHSDSIK